MKTQTAKQSLPSSAVPTVTTTHSEAGMRKYRSTWHALGIWFAIVMLMAAASSARAQNAYEHFDYPAASPINGANGGGGNPGWGARWTGFGDLVVSPGVSVHCNGLAPVGNALGPTPGNASSRPLAQPIMGAAGTSMLLSAVIRSDVNGTGPTQATLGNSSGGTFIMGDLPENDPQASNWAIQNGAGVYYSTKPVVANAETCLVAQIDFLVSISGTMDRMRLWVNPPANRFLAPPDIDITTAHVPQFSGVFWQTQQAQVVDEISITSMPTQALNCVDPPNTTMVAWYPFDELSGGFSANLASGNTGTWYPVNDLPVPVAGKVDGALSFNGIDQYVDAPSTIATNFGPGVVSPPWCSGGYSTCQGDFSIDAWINITSLPPGQTSYTIVDKRSGTHPALYGYFFGLYQNHLVLQLADGLGSTGYSNYLSSALPANEADGNWHHVAVTVHRTMPNGIRWYFDGVAKGTSNPTDRLGSLVNNSPLRIGASTADDPFLQWFQGSLDELEIFNRQLSAVEVQSLYNAQQYGKCKP
jgi:Concanavalin A-like lectin/glucanases superfamily